MLRDRLTCQEMSLPKLIQQTRGRKNINGKNNWKIYTWETNFSLLWLFQLQQNDRYHWHTVQDVYKVASKNYAHTQFWSQHSSVRPKHFKNPHPLPAKDGSLVTGASQDHFVGFHHLTILTGQGNIKEFVAQTHKVILASSSPSFENLWKRNKYPHPLIYMREIADKYSDVRSAFESSQDH